MVVLIVEAWVKRYHGVGVYTTETSSSSDDDDVAGVSRVRQRRAAGDINPRTRRP